MSFRSHTATPLLVILLLAGGLACRKPLPASPPEPTRAAAVPEQPRPAEQVLQNDDADQKRKAGEEMEAARIAAASKQAEYRKAADAALKDVHFDLDKSGIAESDKPVLAAIAAFMKKYPQASVTIDGNCDERGTVEYNLALGERRAAAAMDYLGNLGVASSRLSTLSYGKEKPVCTESVASCWTRNRRAHFALK